MSSNDERVTLPNPSANTDAVILTQPGKTQVEIKENDPNMVKVNPDENDNSKTGLLSKVENEEEKGKARNTTDDSWSLVCLECCEAVLQTLTDIWICMVCSNGDCINECCPCCIEGIECSGECCFACCE